MLNFITYDIVYIILITLQINEKCERWDWWTSLAWAVFLLAQTYQEHSFIRITIFRQWVWYKSIFKQTVACSTSDGRINFQASNQIHKINKVIKSKKNIRPVCWYRESSSVPSCSRTSRSAQTCGTRPQSYRPGGNSGSLRPGLGRGRRSGLSAVVSGHKRSDLEIYKSWHTAAVYWTINNTN